MFLTLGKSLIFRFKFRKEDTNNIGFVRRIYFSFITALKTENFQAYLEHLRKILECKYGVKI